MFSDPDAKSFTKIQTDDRTRIADFNRRARGRQTNVKTNLSETRILM
jgi:hypothetical protein